LIVQRRTVRQTVTFDGVGLHTGVPVTVTVQPSEGGIWLRLGSDRVEAIPANVSDTTRSTKVGPVGTVEHLMSALAAVGVTDAEIEFTAPEAPGLDGSSEPFWRVLAETGTTDLGTRELRDLFSRVFLQEDAIKIAVGKGSGHWRFEFECDQRWPHSQHFELEHLPTGYGAEIAPARTFAFQEEVPHIIAAGLAKGLDGDSALILGPDSYQNESRFADEPVRHKLLDLIGDLYLAGVPIDAINVVGTRSGHRSNVKAAAMLYQATH